MPKRVEERGAKDDKGEASPMKKAFRKQFMINPFKKLREEAGLSQHDLALLADVSQAAISQVEVGAIVSPSEKIIDACNRIADTVGRQDLKITRRKYKEWREHTKENIEAKLGRMREDESVEDS